MLDTRCSMLDARSSILDTESFTSIEHLSSSIEHREYKNVKKSRSSYERRGGFIDGGLAAQAGGI
ncbi:MAG: hypothetical protein AB1797_07510 [bacterium]